VVAAKLGVSRMMVQRVWQRYDVQPHRVEKFKISNDPKFEDKTRDVVGLYLDPPDRAPTHPCAFARSRPAMVRSLSRTRSCFATAASMPMTASLKTPVLSRYCSMNDR
jgi:hypothetical protein